MRIKAYVGGKTPVYEMANGASESVGFIKPGSYVTVTGVKKDGADSYYTTDEYPGYVKKNAIKLLRDEDFYYTSSLIKSKQNRSKSNRFNSMKRSIAASVSNSWISPSSGDKLDNSMISGNGWGGGIQATSVSDGWKNVNDGLVPGYSIQTVRSASNNAGVKPATPLQTIANTALSALTGGGIRGGSTSFGSSALGAMVSGGGFGGAISGSNTGIFGGGLGSLFNGATISNLMDGSFFNDIFSKNALSMIGNILGTLMQKLNYVVGFNMSGVLLGVLGGFAGYGLDGLKFNSILGNSNTQLPDRMRFNGDIDARIRQYFKYKGTTYSMRPYGGVTGGATTGKINYRTGQLSGTTNENSTNEVSVRKEQYSTLYADFAENLTKIRSSVSLNMARQDWFYNFNRFRLLTPNSVLTNTKGYVFFTRPDLNIVSSSATTSEIGLLMYSMATYHSGIVASLQKSPTMVGASFDNGHKLLPLLGNRCTGIDINDETLETKEIGETYTGWKLNYGINNIKSKSANTVTTSFIDDEQLSIYLLFKLWTEYISNVSRGIIAPKDEYVRSLQLDYANSIYYFLTGADGQTILFWTKFTGCIPTNVPSSNFTDNYETAVRMPKYSITWQYAFKKDYDPYTIAEFNRVAGVGIGGRPGSMPIYDSETIRAGRTLAGAPWIDTQTGAMFKLHFREPGNKFNPEY